MTLRRRKVSEAIADRTRQRQPLLPRLVEQARHDHTFYRQLLPAGQAAAAGQVLTVGGRTWIRVFSNADAHREREHGRAHVRLRDAATDEAVHIDRQEERTFWEWASVETLRLSGIRIEELLEISQLSIRQYRRPGGEVAALLIIAPSKTDRERVIPMSAELFTVIGAIIRRHTRDGAVPVVTRYDPHERETLPPLPTSSSAPGTPALPDHRRHRGACPAAGPRSRPEVSFGGTTPGDMPHRVFITGNVRRAACTAPQQTGSIMTSRHSAAAAATAGAAVIAALTLAACGTGASPGTPASVPASAAATTAAFNTADITFTTSMLGLEEQAAAMAGTVTGHTATPELQQFAARMRAQTGDAQRMRELVGGWHQPMPAPYSPGASLPAGMMGAGMMNAADWAEIRHEHGQSFNRHWLDAMISSYNAEVALCRHELGSGASTQARALARAMLTERQSGLAQLQQWHHGMQQMGMMG